MNKKGKRISRFCKWGGSTFGIAVVYVLGFCILSEIHPFSRFPMYSHFPNWSYSFYVTNESDEIIPFLELSTHGGAMGHLYGSVANQLNISYGSFIESEEELRQIGEGMMKSLLTIHQFEGNEIKLYRKAFYYQNDTIKDRVDLMVIYEAN